MDRIPVSRAYRSGRFAWLLLMLGCLAVRGLTQVTSGTAAGGFRIVGYLPDYRAGDFDAVAASRLTDLIVFSCEPTAEGGLDGSRLNGISWLELQALREREKVRLLLAVGGWGRSRHFGKVSTTPALRRAFAAAALKGCDELKLDGLDLDWEHPANAEEEEGYGLLLEELRAVLAPGGRIVSVTVAGWQKLTPLAIRSADLVQLMAYDQPGAHSTFEGARADVEKLLKMGVPRAKLVLGLPFYGRHRTARDRTPTYREILERSSPGPEINEVDGVYFNGPVMIARKTAYARDEGMAGVMIWEVGQDAPGERALLRVIRQQAEGPAALAMSAGRRISSQGFQTLSGELMRAMANGGPTNAIAFCSTRALEVTQTVGGSNRVELRRVSHAPRNPANAANELERRLIAHFQAELQAMTHPPPWVPAPVLRTNATGGIVFYAPIVLSNPLCLQCHGTPGREIAPATQAAIAGRYPADRATGFRVGDVRGLWRVDFPKEP